MQSDKETVSRIHKEPLPKKKKKKKKTNQKPVNSLRENGPKTGKGTYTHTHTHTQIHKYTQFNYQENNYQGHSEMPLLIHQNS